MTKKIQTAANLLSLRSANTFLPLFHHVVFVDWHGVLCKEFFWQSILSNTKHPSYSYLSKAKEKLFNDQLPLVESWMKGKVTAQEVLSNLALPLGKNYREDFWLRRLCEDCEEMKLDTKLVEALASLKGRAWLVLATDNMDCFYGVIDKIPGLGNIFDAVLCSSVLGILKSENPQRFFGEWLRRHNVDPSCACLIDDSRRNCDAFRELGGHTIAYNSVEQGVRDLQNWTYLWFDRNTTEEAQPLMLRHQS